MHILVSKALALSFIISYYRNKTSKWAYLTGRIIVIKYCFFSEGEKKNCKLHISQETCVERMKTFFFFFFFNVRIRSIWNLPARDWIQATAGTYACGNAGSFNSLCQAVDWTCTSAGTWAATGGIFTHFTVAGAPRTYKVNNKQSQNPIINSHRTQLKMTKGSE